MIFSMLILILHTKWLWLEKSLENLPWTTSLGNFLDYFLLLMFYYLKYASFGSIYLISTSTNKLSTSKSDVLSYLTLELELKNID